MSVCLISWKADSDSQSPKSPMGTEILSLGNWSTIVEVWKASFARTSLKHWRYASCFIEMQSTLYASIVKTTF